MGVNHTLFAAKTRYYWKGMYTSIVTKIEECNTCIEIRNIIYSVCKRRKRTKQYNERTLTLDMDIVIIKEAMYIENKK